jgi:hypothetical protein
MQNSNLPKILKLITTLTTQELRALNQATVTLIKSQQDVEFQKAAITFQKGDIVSYLDSNQIRILGVITKKNPKTLQVTTPDNYYVNIPATYLCLETKPPQKLLDFKRSITPTHEELGDIDMFKLEANKNTFH